MFSKVCVFCRKPKSARDPHLKCPSCVPPCTLFSKCDHCTILSSQDFKLYLAVLKKRTTQQRRKQTKIMSSSPTVNERSSDVQDNGLPVQPSVTNVAPVTTPLTTPVVTPSSATTVDFLDDAAMSRLLQNVIQQDPSLILNAVRQATPMTPSQVVPRTQTTQLMTPTPVPAPLPVTPATAALSQAPVTAPPPMDIVVVDHTRTRSPRRSQSPRRRSPSPRRRRRDDSYSRRRRSRSSSRRRRLHLRLPGDLDLEHHVGNVVHRRPGVVLSHQDAVPHLVVALDLRDTIALVHRDVTVLVLRDVTVLVHRDVNVPDLLTDVHTRLSYELVIHFLCMRTVRRISFRTMRKRNSKRSLIIDSVF